MNNIDGLGKDKKGWAENLLDHIASDKLTSQNVFDLLKLASIMANADPVDKSLGVFVWTDTRGGQWKYHRNVSKMRPRPK